MSDFRQLRQIVRSIRNIENALLVLAQRHAAPSVAEKPHTVLNVDQIAASIGKPSSTVYELCRRPNLDGGLPAFKIGRTWSIHLDTLEKWAKEQGQ